MNTGSYVFTQLIKLLPKEAFDWTVKQYGGDKYVKHFRCWNQLFVMVFGQLYGCERLKELVSVISAHSTTIDLCLSLFWWAKFRSTKSGIKAHTLFDVVTQTPAYINITNANVHDTQAMDDIPYEPNAYFIFDRGYFDLAGLYKINIIDSYFIIRQKGRFRYKIVDGEDLVEGLDGIICDQTIELTGYQSRKYYPGRLRRIVYYSKELKRTFTYITNAFYISAIDIAMLYKKRWNVDLFFKWIKQHLYIKSF